MKTKNTEKTVSFRVSRIENVQGTDEPRFTLTLYREKKSGNYETLRVDLTACSWYWLARAIDELKAGAAKNVRSRRAEADRIERVMGTSGVVIPP